MKLHLKKGTRIWYYDNYYIVDKDYWTTCKDLGVGVLNIKKRIAISELFAIYKYKYIDIAVADLEII